MEKLKKALTERLHKSKYKSRTESPGNYKYHYGEKTVGKVTKNKESLGNKAAKRSKNAEAAKKIKIPEHVKDLIPKLKGMDSEGLIEKTIAAGLKIPSVKQLIKGGKETEEEILDDNSEIAYDAIESGLKKEYKDLKTTKERMEFLGVRNEDGEDDWEDSDLNDFATGQIQEMADNLVDEMQGSEIIDKYYIPSSKKEFARDRLDYLVYSYAENHNLT